LREARWSRLSLGIGLAFIGLVMLLCAISPLLPLPAPNAQNYGAVLQAPSAAHLFGTDDVGRDVFSRTLAGGRIDLPLALGVTLLSVLIGMCAGALSGFIGGRVDAVIMRLADIAIAFPVLILVIAVVAIVGPGVEGILIGVPLVGWAIYARLTRAEMLVVREKEYMLSAEVLGLSRSRRLLNHALPNIWRPALAISMIDVVMNIVFVASLSYLGLGVQPPTAEWGGIIAEGQQYLLTAWWIATLPGILIVLVGVGFALAGDAAGDLLGRDLTLAED
jgi:peptide/nickel transport system permease protein